MSLGETIHRLRTEQNLSQDGLADALGVSRQSISKWETNRSVPDLDKLVKLSGVFGVTLDELVLGERPAPAPDPVPPAPPPHADVYKRQGRGGGADGGVAEDFYGLAGEGNRAAAIRANHLILDGDILLLIVDCLLYTSRCV